MQVQSIKMSAINNSDRANNKQNINSQPHFGMVATDLVHECGEMIIKRCGDATGDVLSEFGKIVQYASVYNKYDVRLARMEDGAIVTHLVHVKSGEVLEGTERKITNPVELIKVMKNQVLRSIVREIKGNNKMLINKPDPNPYDTLRDIETFARDLDRKPVHHHCDTICYTAGGHWD